MVVQGTCGREMIPDQEPVPLSAQQVLILMGALPHAVMAQVWTKPSPWLRFVSVSGDSCPDALAQAQASVPKKSECFPTWKTNGFLTWKTEGLLTWSLYTYGRTPQQALRDSWKHPSSGLQNGPGVWQRSPDSWPPPRQRERTVHSLSPCVAGPLSATRLQTVPKPHP